MHWNVNAVMPFTLATNGRGVRPLDPLLYHHPSVGGPLIEAATRSFGQPETL